MIKAQRQKRILEVLRAEGSVDVGALARIMPEVSQVTLRRDIAELADAGSLRRTHGGAVLPDSVLVKHPAMIRTDRPSGEIDDFDAVIVPPIPGRGGDALRRHIKDRNIPFLAESAAQEGGTYLGPDNRAAGQDLGRRAAQHLAQEDHPRVLIVGHPELPNTRDRVDGFVEGLRDTLGDRVEISVVNGQGTYRVALRVALDAMASCGPFQVGFGVNDHCAIALAEAAARSDQDIAVYATGGESAEFVGRLANRRRIRAIAAFFPELVGEQAVDVMVACFHGHPLPDSCGTPYEILDADNLGDFYVQKNDSWALRADRRAPEPKRKIRTRGAKPKIGFMPHFPAHDWYRLMIQSMTQRAAAQGCELIVFPPHKGISAEITRIRQDIARTAAAGMQAGETILIGSGEANLLLAEEIRRITYQEPDRLSGLTVITHALDVLLRLENAPGIKVILTSGEYQSADRCLVGPSLGALFERIRADRAYLAPAGVSRKFGVSSMDERLALAGSRLVEAARETIILADHTLIGIDANHRIARSEAIHEIITDDGALPADRQALRAAGMSVRVAGDDHESTQTRAQDREDRRLGSTLRNA